MLDAGPARANKQQMLAPLVEGPKGRDAELRKMGSALPQSLPALASAAKAGTEADLCLQDHTGPGQMARVGRVFGGSSSISKS